MIGELIDRRMRALGLNQTSLSALTKGELRQNYISQVILGKVQVPLGRKADLFREHLGICREDWYRAAGMLDAPDESEPAPPRVVVVQGPAGETAVPLERVVAYVERFPDERHQARLERWRERHDAATYTRLCARVYIAWSSNYELLLDTLDAVNSR